MPRPRIQERGDFSTGRIAFRPKLNKMGETGPPTALLKRVFAVRMGSGGAGMRPLSCRVDQRPDAAFSDNGLIFL